MYEKYFSPLVKYSVAYLFMPLYYAVGSAAVTVVYSLLNDISPSLFPTFNQVLEKESYLEFKRISGIVAALLTVFVLNLILGINDNARYERVITRTDALYRIPDELPRYLRDTLPGDAIASPIPQLIFLWLSTLTYPERYLKYAHGYLSLHVDMLESFGFFPSVLLIALCAFAARIASAPLSLRKYRGAWLTSFVDS